MKVLFCIFVLVGFSSLANASVATYSAICTKISTKGSVVYHGPCSVTESSNIHSWFFNATFPGANEAEAATTLVAGGNTNSDKAEVSMTSGGVKSALNENSYSVTVDQAVWLTEEATYLVTK